MELIWINLVKLEIKFELKVAPPWSPDCPVPGTAIFFQRGAKTRFGCRGGTATLRAVHHHYFLETRSLEGSAR